MSSAIPNLWRSWQEAFFEEATAHAERIKHLPTVWERLRQVKKGATPSEVVYEEDTLKLRRYLSDAAPKYRTPLVVVFALVNRPYILDLKPDRSVVGHFIRAGFDTYLIDWGSPTQAQRHLSLDDYVNGYLANVIDYVRERADVPSVNILGYCMGGTMSTIYTALHQERVRNLILMAAGIDFSTRDGLLNLWTRPEYFDVDKFIDTLGNCPAEFLQSTFLLLKPVQNLLEKQINFFENANDEKFLDDFLTMETWLNDNIPVAGEVFREFVKYMYQGNLLVQNKLAIGKHTVNLRHITCPVLNLMARSDDLVPCAQSAPFNDLVGSTDRKSIVVEAGHVGLAVGSKAQKQAWPEAARWLAERN